MLLYYSSVTIQYCTFRGPSTKGVCLSLPHSLSLSTPTLPGRDERGQPSPARRRGNAAGGPQSVRGGAWCSARSTSSAPAVHLLVPGARVVFMLAMLVHGTACSSGRCCTRPQNSGRQPPGHAPPRRARHALSQLVLPTKDGCTSTGGSCVRGAALGVRRRSSTFMATLETSACGCALRAVLSTGHERGGV